MPEPFDPYYTWLGIPPNEQPADFYRLLGIKRFEENREVISNAADQRMAHIRTLQNGPSAADSQRVLNELSKAAGCLLNPRRKAMYDQHLQSSGVTARTEQALLPPQPNTIPVQVQVATTPQGVKRALPAASRSRSKQRIKIVFGGAGLAVAVAAVVSIYAVSSRFSPDATAIAVAPPSDPPVASVPETVIGNSQPQVDPAPNATRPAAEPIATAVPMPSPPIESVSTATPSAPEAGTATTKEPPSETAVPKSATVPTGTAIVEPTRPEIPPGRPKALHFRGNDRIELAGTSGLLDLRQSFSVETWVRFAPESTSHWIAGDLIIGPNHAAVPSSAVAGWQLFIQQTQNERHRVVFSTREGYANDFPVSANAWHHIAACGDTRQLIVYVDGRRTASGEIARLQASFAPSPIPIHIGGHEYMHPSQPPGLTGDLRAFRISSVCRYSSNFEPAGSWTKDADTLVLLDVVNSTGNRLVDLSGRGHDGTIVGAEWIEAELLATPAIAATTPKPATPLPAAAATPTPPAPTPPTPAPVAAVPQPIPDEIALVQAREQMRTVLKGEFEKSKEPSEQIALAEKLLRLAAESKGDLAGQYAMFDEAHKLATQSGDLTKSLSIIDDLARRFAIDATSKKVAALTKIAGIAKTTADRRKLAEVALGLLEDLIVAGKFDEASEVAQTANAAAARAKDVELGKTAREYRDEIAQAKKQLNSAHEAESKLADDPQNEELNLRWGRFLCFHQRNWSRGLPHLALGGVPTLAAAATQDLTNPTKADEQSSVGRLWSDAVKSVEASERPAVAMRAVYWLRQAEKQLTGLAKANVEKQAKDLEASLPARLRALAGKPAKPAGSAAFQPPREFLGALGRIQVNGTDAGVLWKYEAGMRLTNQSVFDILNQANMPRGKKRMEFVGLLYAHESMTVNIGHSGGSPTATASLMVDNKPLGDVGGTRATTDIYKVELNAGEHTIRWVLNGDDFGNCSLSFTNAATAQLQPMYHNQPLLNLVRESPSRPRLNVNMTRN